MIRDYAIMTVDESRAENKANTRAVLGAEGWVEHFPEWVDGRTEEGLLAFFAAFPRFRVDGWRTQTMGAVGYWGSLLSAMRYVAGTRIPLLLLEDDAEVYWRTVPLLDGYLLASSTGIDFFQAFTLVDRANPHDKYYGTAAAPEGVLVSKSWHQWPLGAIVVFPSGADKILRWVDEHPVRETGDMTVTNLGRSDIVVIESPAPGRESPVKMRHGSIPSTIEWTPPVSDHLLPRSAV